MTLSVRHQNHIRLITADGHKLTARERVKAGIAPNLRAARLNAVEAPEPPAQWWMLNWFLLSTMAGQEQHTARHLFDAGIAAFCPVELVERRSNRYTRNVRATVHRPILPAMIAVGFGAGTPPWLHLLGPSGVRDERFLDLCGVLSINGQPLQLSPMAVKWLVDNHRRRGRKGGYDAKIGNIAMVSNGQFAGVFGEIVRRKMGDATLEVISQIDVNVEPVHITVPEIWLQAAGY